MKRLIFLFLVLLGFIVPEFSIAAAGGPARLQFLHGDILFRAEDDDEWLLASVNTPLYEGDTLWCPYDSKVEIRLPEGSIVRLDGGSELHLLDNEEDFIHLYLAKGRLYLSTAETLSPNSLQIDADDTTLLPSGNTKLRFDMLRDSQEDVSVLKGSAYVEGNGNRTRVRAGDHIALEEDRSELLPLNLPDEWERWNIERDRAKLRSVYSNNYLPDELQSYADELNTNGRWIRAAEYGMVWQPSVVFSATWSPYTNGRWVWRGNDYVWISFDVWGWVPFHYGRWSVVTGSGWCWVPPIRGDVYWAPGYVGWYRSGSHVGWTPLAPGEKYYGHGHYGRNSVNIINTTINVTNIEYKNRHARGGMTVVGQSDFLKGRTVPRSAVKSSVPIKVSTGSPRIKPLRETRMPVVKQIPPVNLPLNRDSQVNRDLRQRFPKVKDERNHDKQQQQSRPQTVISTPSSVQPTPQKVMRSNQKTEPLTPQTAAQPSTTSPENKSRSQHRVVPAVAEERSNTQRVENPQRQQRQREVRERKVWRVATPGSEKAVKAPAKAAKSKVDATKPLKDKESKENGRQEK